MRLIISLVATFSYLAFSSCEWNLKYIDLTPPVNCWTQGDCECGSDLLYDNRDGRAYETVWIDEDGGNDISKPGQCWMKENLNYGNFVKYSIEMKNDAIHQKFCVYDDPNQCDLYGGYYFWREAMNYEADLSDSTKLIQGLCPNGWHLPLKSDFDRLFSSLDGNSNQFLYLSGFSGQLSGYRGSDDNYSLIDLKGFLWSSTPNGQDSLSRPWVLEMGTANVSINNFLFSTNGACIRCILDEN